MPPTTSLESNFLVPGPGPELFQGKQPAVLSAGAAQSSPGKEEKKGTGYGDSGERQRGRAHLYVSFVPGNLHLWWEVVLCPILTSGAEVGFLNIMT